MIRHGVIQLVVAATCVALLVGCGAKDADEAEKGAASPPSAGEKDVVELTEAARENAPIKTIEITRTNVNALLTVPAQISYDLNRTAKVSSPFAGHILKMNYDVGATVTQGDTMALLDSPESLKPLELKATLNGVVTERQGAVGAMLDAAKELYAISNLRRVWCIASVGEDDSAAVHVGQPAAVRVLAYPSETFTGAVVLAGQAVDEATRTIEARIDVDNPDGKLKPGMFATVFLPTERMENQLLVPDGALQTVSGQTCVFVEEQPGKYRLIAVRLGGQIGNQYPVLEGLEAGAHVVVAGSFVLKSELLKASMEEP
ncbi:MAG TPA: efflux RND transporter periplasmic adaptor subunit [Verrucomicrobiae bacterium]|nr:efflux RND transporter periplasmic adaptor subunit [Verrucomicrobiae bacterium]